MRKVLLILFVVLAIGFLGLAIYYWVTPAGSLPHNFPGYEAGSTHVHLKHGLASLILAIGSGIVAWFSSKGSSISKENTKKEQSQP